MRWSVFLLIVMLLFGVTPVNAFHGIPGKENPLPAFNFNETSSRVANATGELVKVNVNGEEVAYINSLPVTITESGYYVLNVSANVSGTAIEIDADNVVLDGNGNTIRGEGWGIGVYISNHKNITIKNLKIENFDTGVYLYSSTNVTLANNTLNNNWAGVGLDSSTNVTLKENTIMNNNWRGVGLYSSTSVVLSLNVFVNDGLIVIDSHNNTVVNNTVNGRPLVYVEDSENYTLTTPNYAGQVIIVNSKNVLIANQNLSNTTVGVELWNVQNTRIENNTIMNNNDDGVYLDSSTNVVVFLNSFVNNSWQVSIYNSENVSFHSPEPLTYAYEGKTFTGYLGNYWSDYTGTDSNGDGVGDSPYVITGSITDDYPLIAPVSSYRIIHRLKGDVNGDGRITAADALLYLRYVVGLDISPYHIDPAADDLTGDGKITIADALKALRIAAGLESI